MSNGKLSGKQWLYVSAVLANPGMSKAGISRLTGIPLDTIYGWNKKAPQVHAQIEQYQDSIRQAVKPILERASLTAVMVLIDLLHSDNEYTRQRASTIILNHVWGKP